MMSTRQLRPLAVLALLVLVAACASESRKAEEPAELVELQSTANIRSLWKASAGDGAPKLRLGLSLAADDAAIYAASHAGSVMAFNKANGRRLWSTNTRLSLTGGPGVGEGLVVAGASHGQLVALDAATGAIKWQGFINSELLSTPVIAKGVVALRTVDGRVAVFRASDGTEIWSAEQQVPRLSLRGTSSPLIVGDLVVVGFDNGRVQALRLNDGFTAWDVNLAPPGGKTELDRLNDIDTVMRVRDGDLYVVTFQGKVARLDLETGDAAWTRDASSYSGLAVDDSGVYVSTAEGAVVKITLDGIESWNTEVLARRKLSPPAVIGDLVAVADLEGYVHFLDRDTGDLAGRVHPLSARVSADPVVSDGTVFVLDVAGNIAALRSTSAPPVASTPTPTPVATPGPAAAPTPTPRTEEVQERTAPPIRPR